jgi:hypothetical protein
LTMALDGPSVRKVRLARLPGGIQPEVPVFVKAVFVKAVSLIAVAVLLCR